MKSRRLFLLDPGVVYLNHGSFGACPRPVFDVYQEWQREVEREPVNLLARRLEDEFARVRTALAAYVGATADDLALVPNATAGMNAVLRSLRLEAGDELLTTEHEYGAIDLLLDFVSERTGARVVRRPGEDADAIWAGVSERTRALVVSHVTSPTAVLLPVAELCGLAKEAGVLSVVDGAHGPGQIPLDLEGVGADFYAGNCHKWLCAPKGAGFLYVRPERQELLAPRVVGWGYRESEFSLRHGPQGTGDPSAYLAVPAAIEFVRQHGAAAECRALLEIGLQELAAAGFHPYAAGQPLQMASFRLPACDAEEVERRLFEEFRIEAPVRNWNGQPLIRVSVAPYNTPEDLAVLSAGLSVLFPPGGEARVADRDVDRPTSGVSGADRVRNTSSPSHRREDQMAPSADMGAVFDEHTAAEFVQRDLDAAMATMTDDPYVYQVPVMTGGVGFEGVRRFYGQHFIGKWPADTQLTPISRTVGEDQVVDEILLSFTHDVEMDSFLPGVAPTGRSVRLPLCAVVKFEGGKIAHEHIYWDNASLLVQVGLIDPADLPVTGAEQAENLLDPRAHPTNELMHKSR